MSSREGWQEAGVDEVLWPTAIPRLVGAARHADQGHAQAGMQRSGAALRFSVGVGSGVPDLKHCPWAASRTQKPAQQLHSRGADPL